MARAAVASREAGPAPRSTVRARSSAVSTPAPRFAKTAAARPRPKKTPPPTARRAPESATIPAAPRRPVADSCARTFRAFCLFGLLVTLIAGATVWVRTDCAQGAYTLSRIKSDIVAERQTSEDLSVKALAMATPRRIEKVAAGRLAMVDSGDITFLRRPMPPQRPAPRREALRRRLPALAGVAGWLARTAQDFTILSIGELGLPTVGR